MRGLSCCTYVRCNWAFMSLMQSREVTPSRSSTPFNHLYDIQLWHLHTLYRFHSSLHCSCVTLQSHHSCHPAQTSLELHFLNRHKEIAVCFPQLKPKCSSAPVCLIFVGKDKPLHAPPSQQSPLTVLKASSEGRFYLLRSWCPCYVALKSLQRAKEAAAKSPGLLNGQPGYFCSLFYLTLSTNVLPRAKGLESPPLGSPTITQGSPPWQVSDMLTTS